MCYSDTFPFFLKQVLAELRTDKVLQETSFLECLQDNFFLSFALRESHQGKGVQDLE